MKQKACKVCRARFDPRSPMQVVCGPSCAIQHAAKAREKKAKAAQAEEKRQDRVKRESLKTIPDYIKEAQHAFNAYIRLRDEGAPCICCGQPLGGPAIGGGFDCGHFRSVGSASHLRFDERNAHGQRKVCNRYGSGRAVDYRIGLVQRIGLAAVEALESDNTPHKWTREELIAIKAEYMAKAKELKKRLDAA